MPASDSPAPRIELLIFKGCPNIRAAHELIERVSASRSIKPELEVVVVADTKRALASRFLGSPTIRVEGHDIEPGADERTDYTLACRVYATSSGLAGVPDEAWLREALPPDRPV